ncbi:hypothetical protein B0H94_11714 [Salsuginibacillus halophilus]|uniref:Helicase HerA central domain-containing protein n=1 Tax=Salsuginibacillus halophilus TaxID=517424 RepID=A0A2P8H7R8_9BACI|nr:ATP-binding protein [Salsuginibacillus halophilus]PSL42241.1 hypothetical protein B0H94_11714 [Salsuginibacillus halophilus]
MQIVGVTTQQEVYIASKDRKFRINEIFLIEDETVASPMGEVVETFSYNRFIPMGFEQGMMDQGLRQALEQIGYDIGADDIHLAKLRLFEEAVHPIQTGAGVRPPVFDEVKHLLIRGEADSGLVLGEIRSTDHMHHTLPEAFDGLLEVLEHGEVRPQHGAPLLYDIQSMQQYPHIGIFGGSGSGKSFGMRVMLEELMKLDIPTLVFDPHFEMSFSDAAPSAGDVKDYSQAFTAVQVGQDVGVDFTALSTRDVERLLAAASPLSESMANVVQSLHKRKDSHASFADRISNTADALELGKHRVESVLTSNGEGLSKEEFERYDTYRKLLDQFGSLPPASVKGIQWRLGRLAQAGLFQHNIQAVENALYAGKLVVIQGSSWLLQVFASYVTSTLYNKRRTYRDAKLKGEAANFFPPFIVATDEAHNFAPKGMEAPSKPTLKEIAQEGRKYGAFLIMATQRPTLLDETITAQLNTKFVFRTVRGTDIQTIKEETDLTAEESQRLPYLRSGDAFVSSALFGRTIPTRIRMAHTTTPHVQNPFDELKEMKQAEDGAFLDVIRDYSPLSESDLMAKLSDINGRLGTSYTVNDLKDELERLEQQGKVKKQISPFASLYTVT